MTKIGTQNQTGFVLLNGRGESLKQFSVHDPSPLFSAPNKKESEWVMDTSELFLRTHLSLNI